MKKRNRIIYANQGIFAGPAFQDNASYAENIYDPNLSKVQSISYGTNINKEVQEYNSNLQKDTARYTWYGQQYQIIDAQYKEFLQSLQGQLNKQ